MSFSGFFPTWCVQREGGQQGDGRAERCRLWCPFPSSHPPLLRAPKRRFSQPPAELSAGGCFPNFHPGWGFPGRRGSRDQHCSQVALLGHSSPKTWELQNASGVPQKQPWASHESAPWGQLALASVSGHVAGDTRHVTGTPGTRQPWPHHQHAAF